MALVKCKECDKEVSAKAYKCPSCGAILRKLKRGIFGKIFLWLFVLFNITMIFMLVSVFNVTSDQMSTSINEAEEIGTAIGATLGTGMIFGLWVVGDIILGMFVLFSKPKEK